VIKLFYAPGACSLSPHIALREAGVPFELQKVDFMRGKKLPDGADFSSVNPKGYVPAIVLENGELLTEGSAIVQYIADLRPESALAPEPGSFERVRLQEWLNFIATELHKGLGPFFGTTSSPEAKEAAKQKFQKRLDYVEEKLAGKSFLLGDPFTVADGYLLYALRAWERFAKGTLSPALAAYRDRVVARPAVKEALAAEGLD
jgi:glutathione S-transferase